MGEEIKKILSIAITAPSGENCQPWKFKIEENKILLYNLPERDSSLYSWGQRSSYVAHGALIENIAIAAKEYGYEAEILLFPDDSQENLVAQISLHKKGGEKDPLFKNILLRCTNRKPYQTSAISEEKKQKLIKALGLQAENHLKLVDKPDQINFLSKFSSLNERIIFENRPLHDFFFKHINWSKEEDNKKSIGFYIETLELPPPAKGAFKLVKHWSILNVLNKIGFSKAVGKDNSKTHSAAGAHGIIYVSNTTKENFILAGRIFERFWLTATGLGLSLQPMTGILFLFLKIQAGDVSGFSQEQVRLIKEAYGNIEKTFEVRNQIIPMYFRIGVCSDPSARSSRLPLEITL